MEISFRKTKQQGCTQKALDEAALTPVEKPSLVKNIRPLCACGWTVLSEILYTFG